MITARVDTIHIKKEIVILDPRATASKPIPVTIENNDEWCFMN